MDMRRFMDFVCNLTAKLTFSVEFPLPLLRNRQTSLRRNPDFAQKPRFFFASWLRDSLFCG